LPSAFEKGTSLYPELADYLRRETQHGALYPQLIRAYYYDALPERSDERYPEQESYLQDLGGLDYFDVKVGRLKKTGDGSLKQKGVDTLIAIDIGADPRSLGGVLDVVERLPGSSLRRRCPSFWNS
jgi:hypothetical protein